MQVFIVDGDTIVITLSFSEKKCNDVRSLKRSSDWSSKKVLRFEDSAKPRVDNPRMMENDSAIPPSGPFASTNKEIVLGTSHRCTFFSENDSVMTMVSPSHVDTLLVLLLRTVQ